MSEQPAPARRFLRVFALGALLLAAGIAGLPVAVEAQRSRVAETIGLTVLLGAPEGRGLDPRITGTEPTALQALVALGGLRRATLRYPDTLLTKHVSTVLIVGRLEVLGFRVGGTVQPGRIILASDYIGPGAGPGTVACIFHHELSSLLIADAGFPFDAWRAALPEGFAYPETDVDRLQATQTVTDDLDSFRRIGFVSDYGASSLENDINTYAALLMSDADELARLARAHPRIARKAHLIADFYTGLHPALDIGLAMPD